MKKSVKLIWSILGVAGSIAAILGFWITLQRDTRFNYQLEEARQSVGTKKAGLLLNELAEQRPKNGEVHFLLARQMRLQGDNDRALTYCQQAADRSFSTAQVSREILLIRAEKEFRPVEPELQRFLETTPDDRDVLLTLALGWSRLNNLAKADALVNSILQRDPEHGAALWVRGKIRLQNHQAHDACPDLEKAVGTGRPKNGPNQYYYSRARFLLANCYLELGKFDRALELFQEARAEEPENPRILFGMGRCYWFLSRWDEAGESFVQVLRLQPDHLDALSQLAYIHEERGQPGDLAQALELLERAAKLDPTWYDLHFRMAKIMKALGQNERAAQEFQRAELVKKAWAKPRANPFVGRNPYAGDEPGSLRKPVDD